MECRNCGRTQDSGEPWGSSSTTRDRSSSSAAMRSWHCSRRPSGEQCLKGDPHLVTMLGEAGVVTTRLIQELEKYLDGLPEVFHWRKGRCHSYRGGTMG